jgi:hypothetical protein
MRRFVWCIPLLALMSCATIVSGPREHILVDSLPSGAAASIDCDGKPAGHGVTPATIEIPRGALECKVRVERSGFIAGNVELERGVNKKYWLNLVTVPLVVVGVVGINGFFSKPDSQSKMMGTACLVVTASAWGIDRHTGAMHEHQPQKITVTLKPQE